MRGGLYSKEPAIGRSATRYRLLRRISVNFQAVHFLTSAATLAQCPADEGAEVAFCGRSNAGKSSAINTLTGRKNLARTSKTPGRTQLLNFFAVTDQARLVDLPGYGYAKAPKRVKDHWSRHLDEYLRNRRCLKGMVLLMDIRHPMKPFDLMMIDWSAASQLPLHILLTKADKLKPGNRQSSLLAVSKVLPGHVTLQTFSATRKLGLVELEKMLLDWLV